MQIEQADRGSSKSTDHRQVPPRSMRKCTTEGEEGRQTWLAAQEETDVVIKVKPTVRVVGFDDASAPAQDSDLRATRGRWVWFRGGQDSVLLCQAW